MEIEKSSLQTKNTKKHDLKVAKKALNKAQNLSFDDVDSLSCLKQRKTENIDNKFSSLKSELQSLFYNPKAETSGNLSRNQIRCDKFKKHQGSNIGSSPKLPKFAEWLSDTIDEINTKSPNSSTSNKLDSDISLESTAKLGFKSKYNMTLLPKYKVERLIYKSFQLKNLGIYVLSSSDESEGEQLKSNRLRNQKKRSKRTSKRSFSSSFPRKNFKRKRTLLDYNVEVINLEDSLEKDGHKEIDCIDLDIDDFNWNEPFCSHSASDCSDLEVIEESQSDGSSSMEKQNDCNINNNNAKVDLSKSDLPKNSCEPNSNKDFTSPGTKRIWECPICFESSQGQSIVATVCGHIFCKTCLEKHNSTHGKLCPTCRFDISNKVPITLFNI